MESIEQALANEYPHLFARTLVGSSCWRPASPSSSAGATFVEVVRNYKLLPEALVAPVGRLIPLCRGVGRRSVFADLLQPFAALAGLFSVPHVRRGARHQLLRGRRHISCGLRSVRGAASELGARLA